MRNEYFIGRNQTSYIPQWERIALFFEEVFKYQGLCADKYDAFNLLQKILVWIEASALNHNEKVKSITQNNELCLCEMELTNFRAWNGKISGFTETIIGTRTTKQYLLIGTNGAIEIHQKICSHSIFDGYHEWYKENEYETLVLKRPGYDFKDIWGRDLDCPIEEFSLRPNQQGLIYLKEEQAIAA